MAKKKVPTSLSAKKKPSAPKGKTSTTKKPEKSLAKKVVAEIVSKDEDPFLKDSDPQQVNSSVEAPYENLEDSELEEFDQEEVRPPVIKKASKLPATQSEKTLTVADPLSVYMAEVRKYPLLTREQELEIAKKYYETKDPKAAQMLVTSNLRFVVKVAAEYSRFSAKLIDLVQEGNMGLMHAVREFNPYKNVRLITYAVWWIRGHIQEYLMKQYSLVKIGTTQNQKKLFYQLKREKEELDKLLENDSSIKAISQKLDIPEDEVKFMAQRMSGKDISLNRPLDDESGASLLDLQTGVYQPNIDEQIDNRQQLSLLKTKIEELRPELNEKEMIILEERILADEPLTLQEIGEKYGTTREAVRQMEARIMKKIKDRFLTPEED